MSKLTQLGRNNPLWRRVQRHAQMSAIFAPPVSTAVASPPTFASAKPVTAGDLEPWDIIETAVPPNQSAPSSPPIIRSTLRRTETVAAAVATPQPTQTQPPTDSEKVEDEAHWRRLQTIMQRYRQKRAVEKSSEETAPAIQQKTEAAVEPPASDKAEAVGNEAAPDESAAPAVQSVPLEAAWPVQKKSGEAQPPAVTPPPSSAPPNVVQRAPMPEAEASQINQNLARVAPGRQTQSPIETLMPSRPRPMPRGPNLGRQQPADKTAMPETASPKSTADETTAVSPAPSQPKLIQTEIGPLPADLWETLGERPPEAPTADEPTAAAAPAGATIPVLPRQERIEADPTPDERTVPSVEQKDVAATAVPTSDVPNTMMAKPVRPTAKSSLKSQTTPTNAAAQSSGEIQGKIQRRAMETAVLTPPTAPPNSEASKRKVNITQKPTAETEPAREKTTHLAHKAAISPAPPKPLAKRAASKLIQAKPVQPPKTISQAEATAVTTPPGSQTQPISPAPAAPTNRETGAATKQHQPTGIPSKTVVQRLPDLPAALETVTEVASPGLMEMMSEQATAVLNEISPTGTEEESTTEADLDIDALSWQVYQQLKRKLAVEWERGYGR